MSKVIRSMVMLFMVMGSGSVFAADFDKALSVIPKKLAASEVTCHFYSQFLVKQFIRKDKSVEKISVAPWNGQRSSVCDENMATGEVELKWLGSFLGAKAHFIFIAALNGKNGGEPFAIFDVKTGQKVFEDVAKGSFDFLTTPKSEVVMSYRKVVKTSCSLLEDDACWEKTRGKLHLTRFNKPSCEEGYKNSLDQIAKNRCQSVRDDSAECYSMRLHEAATKYENAPSMLSYPAQLNLVGDKMTPTPVTGGVECWLAYE